MAWTTPATAVAGTPISATFWNTQVRDNIAYVHSGKPATAIYRTTGSYSPGGSFADLDATNMSITISTTTGRVLVVFTATGAAPGGTDTISLDVAIDGVRKGGANGLVNQWVQGNANLGLVFTLLVVGLSIGSHTFRVQAKRAAGTGIILADGNNGIHFAVAEL